MDKIEQVKHLHDPSIGSCEYCGKVAELRPYGKNGAKICFDCGMNPKNIETTKSMFDGKTEPDQNN